MRFRGKIILIHLSIEITKWNKQESISHCKWKIWSQKDFNDGGEEKEGGRNSSQEASGVNQTVGGVR